MLWFINEKKLVIFTVTITSAKSTVHKFCFFVCFVFVLFLFFFKTGLCDKKSNCIDQTNCQRKSKLLSTVPCNLVCLSQLYMKLKQLCQIIMIKFVNNNNSLKHIIAHLYKDL